MFEFETSMSRPSAYELHRQARRAQSEAFNAFVGKTVCKLMQWIGTFASSGIPLTRTLVAEWRLRRDIKMLRSLEDRALRDMGLTRGEIDRLVRHGRPRSHTADATRRERRLVESGRHQPARVYAGARGR